MEEVAAGIHDRTLGNKTYDLSAGDTYATSLGGTADFIERYVEGCSGDIGDVHRHLCDTVLINEPADGLGAGECTGDGYGIAIGILHGFAVGLATLTHGASFLANVKCDGISTTGGSGVEVEVDSNEEVACSDGCGTGASGGFVKRTVAEVGTRTRFSETVNKAFVFTLTAHGEIFSLGGEGCGLVAIYRNAEFVSNPACKFTRQLGTFLEGDTAHGHEWTNIGSSHSRMCSMMVAHVDHLGRFLDTLKGCFHDVIGATYESNHGAVGGLTGIHVKQSYGRGRTDGIGYGFDHTLVASFAEIRDTLYQLGFHFTIYDMI